MDNNNQTKKDQLNDYFFQEEGEYIIDQKPKYKYEIKIIHDANENHNNKKSRIKSKTPDKIIKSSKFTILNNPKNNKYINNNNNYKNNYVTNDNNCNEHYVSYSNYNFYNKNKLSKRKQVKRRYSNSFIQQKACIIDIISKTSDNFYKSKNYKKHKIFNDEYCYNNENIENNKQCICLKEFSEFIQQNFGNQKNKDKKKYNINTVECRRNLQHKKNMQNTQENNYNYSHYSTRNKKFFEAPLRIEKPIEQIYQSERNVNSPINKFMYKKIYNKNLNINKKLKKNSIDDLYNDNNKKENVDKKIEKIEKIPSNYSFLSIDDSKNKPFSQYCSSIPSKKDKSQNISNINNNDSFLSRDNNGIMIHKSSERKENIKSISKDQRIEPLVVKKSVKKPIIETIKKKDGTSMNVMKQTTVITSIETTPIEKKKSSNSNLVKECITNIYTTLTKTIDESNEKILIKNKSYDNIKLSNNIKKNGNKKVFVKRKIMDDNYNNKKVNLIIFLNLMTIRKKQSLI
jgi:hypothetical protein